MSERFLLCQVRNLFVCLNAWGGRLVAKQEATLFFLLQMADELFLCQGIEHLTKDCFTLLSNKQE